MSEPANSIDPILDPRGVAMQWMFRVRRMQVAHYDAARRYSSYRFWLGCTVIMLGTVVGLGTMSFATTEFSNQLWIKVLFGSLSALSAAVAGIQTFLNYPELSERHRVAGARFANLKHKLEILVARQPLTPKQLTDELAKIENLWAKLRTASPNLPQSVWDPVEVQMTVESFSQDLMKANMLHRPDPARAQEEPRH